MITDNKLKMMMITLTTAWVVIFSILPFVFLIITSFLNRHVVHHDFFQWFNVPLSIHNYAPLEKAIAVDVLRLSLRLAMFATFICLILGYPIAYWLGRSNKPFKSWYLLCIVLVFWTSPLVKSYALIYILKPILFTDVSLTIGFVYILLPIMIISIMTNVFRIDPNLFFAAQELGANTFTLMRRIVLPLTLPGIIAGCTLVFLPSMTLFYIPDILGNRAHIIIGRFILNQFLFAHDWPLGAAIATALMLVLAIFMLIYFWAIRHDKERGIG